MGSQGPVLSDPQSLLLCNADYQTWPTEQWGRFEENV